MTWISLPKNLRSRESRDSRSKLKFCSRTETPSPSSKAVSGWICAETPRNDSVETPAGKSTERESRTSPSPLLYTVTFSDLTAFSSIRTSAKASCADRHAAKVSKTARFFMVLLLNG